MPWIIQIEAFLSATELLSILNAETTSTIEEDIKNFLSDRLNRVSQSSIAYDRDPALPINKICLKLTEMVDQKKVHYSAPDKIPVSAIVSENKNHKLTGNEKLQFATLNYLKNRWEFTDKGFIKDIKLGRDCALFSFTHLIKSTKIDDPPYLETTESIDDSFSFFIQNEMIPVDRFVYVERDNLGSLNPDAYYSEKEFGLLSWMPKKIICTWYDITPLRIAFDKKMPNTLFAILEKQSALPLGGAEIY
jgi:hypothetical protein